MHKKSGPDAHWRGALRGGFVRTNFALCGVRDTDPGVEFTSRERMIGCPTCKRLKALRAAVARQRLAAIEAKTAT